MDKEVPEEAFYEEMLPREAEDNYPLEEDTGLAEPCMLSADISFSLKEICFMFIIALLAPGERICLSGRFPDLQIIA